MSKTQTKNTQIHPNKKIVQKEAEYQEFVRFTASPRVFREKEFGYNLDRDFAKKYKVNPSTLSAWKKDQKFWDEVKNLLKFWGKDKIPDILASVYKKIIKDGSATEAKFFLQYVDDWKALKSNETYVVVSKNDGIVYKRVVNKLKDQKSLVLKSDNKSYEPYPISADDVMEIWKAKAYISMSFPEPEQEMSISQLTSIMMEMQKKINNI